MDSQDVFQGKQVSRGVKRTFGQISVEMLAPSFLFQLMDKHAIHYLLQQAQIFPKCPDARMTIELPRMKEAPQDNLPSN